VVSWDFIKARPPRHDFLRTCPDFVIVDESPHLRVVCRGDAAPLISGTNFCRSSPKSLSASRARHRDTAQRQRRRVPFPTHAAPRLNLKICRTTSAALTRRSTAAGSQRISVQRRRADLRHFLQRDTPFPERKDTEAHYELSPAYKALFREGASTTPARPSPTHPAVRFINASAGGLRSRSFERWPVVLRRLPRHWTERSNVLEASDATAADGTRT